VSSLTRQCCCGPPDVGCDTCEFCDCSQSGSITLSWSGTYAGFLKTRGRLNNNAPPCDCPGCFQTPGGDCCPIGGYFSGTCAGVFTSSGSATIPLVTSSPPLQTVYMNGTCFDLASPGIPVVGCRTWAGFGTSSSLSFSANTTQTPYTFTSSLNGETYVFNPCSVIKRCIFAYSACPEPYTDDIEEIGTVSLQPPLETYVSVSCNSSVSSAVCGIKHVTNCKDDGGCSTATGRQTVDSFKGFRFGGWYQHTKSPKTQSLFMANSTEWITLSASIT